MIFDKLKCAIKTPEIEFFCEERDFGIIPKPFSARKSLPEWYKELPQYVERENNANDFSILPTIKRCPPFLDAMVIGWIIPLAADVYFKSNQNGSYNQYKSEFYKPIIENHFEEQITSKKSPNPNLPKPPLKWMNYWQIKVPRGYSVLFIPPLNRPENRFTCLSGIVDCDEFEEYINFPFFWNVSNFNGIIHAGTPLVQVIPIKRDNLIKKSVVRKSNKKEIIESSKFRRRYSVSSSIYRNFIWKRK